MRGATATPNRESSPPAGVLNRVRALLAQAEATSFDQEAEAFTAKAQELMARYRIERALVDTERQDRREHRVGRRCMDLPNPYADAKAALLDGIATANGCSAIWSKEHGFVTVFGFEPELEAVDALFTSLLVQATRALRRQGSKRDGYGRNRTKRFRRSFLIAFAIRIEQRLREAIDVSVRTASEETGVALVPILVDREEATRAAAAAAFPSTRAFAPRVSDGEGWYAGRVFADQVDLSSGPSLDRRSA